MYGANFIEIMADPAHDAYPAMKRWCGGRFNPTWFDQELINKDVQEALAGKPQIRQNQTT